MKNYKLKLKEKIDDIQGQGFIYEHKSGAKVIYIENDDENRVFSVCIKTLPKDNTGLAHIMEHCVLCGSEKFRVKDPFNELDKGSINTYLNAITFYDKTLFPVASTNEKDFYNLMEVYLDGVFFPLIYEREGIFLQEGWHKEKNGINGVVYNEMLGAFSEPEEILDFKLREALFSDTDYKYYSGGVPGNIPELKYEKFLDFHRNYYHPSNSIIYVYGKNNMEKCLDFLDREFLSRFERKEIKTEYKEQSGFDKEKNIEVYCREEESILGAVFVTGLSKDYINVAEMSVLCDVLFNLDSSPVKNALIKSGICTNVYAYTDEDMYQSIIAVKIQGSKEKDTDKFRKIITESLNDICESGLNERLVKGCILNESFYLAEGDFGYKPKGLFYNLRLLQGFMYGREDFENLKFKKIYDKVREADFTALIREKLIENKCCVYGISKNTAKEVRLPKFDKIKPNEDKFSEYQAMSDKREDIEKIPHILLSEIGREPFKLNSEALNGGRVIFNPIIKSDISYFNLVIDTKGVPFELKKYLGIFRYLLGKVDTEKYNAAELNNEINYYFGDFDAYFSSYYLNGTRDFMTSINISVKALNENKEKIFEIIREIIFKSRFSDSAKIEEKLKELKNETEDNFYASGVSVAALRCLSYFNDMSRYSENIRGIEFYDFLCTILEKGCYNELEESLLKLRGFLLKKENVFLSLSGVKASADKLIKDFDLFCRELADEKNTEDFLIYDGNGIINEGFVLSGDVSCNVMAADYFKAGFDFSGKLQVLNKIVSSQYLWNKVRGENGAYGADLSIRRNGTLFFSSFRDPRIENTYKIYEKTFDFLNEADFTQRDIKNYIIGTINILDRPVKDNMLSEISLFRHFSGIGFDVLKKEREEILSFEKENIKELSEIFREILKDSFFCSIGRKDDIYSSEKYFENIRKIKKGTAIFNK